MRVHVLTGAGSGIGARLAARLAARGDRLVLVVRPSGDVALDEAERIDVDLADPAAIAAAGSALRAAVGERLDSLIHIAGVVDLAPVAELRADTWNRQLAVNLSAPALLTAELLGPLRAAAGTAVFVNSTAAAGASPGWSAYAASKAGLRALADALRAEEAKHGVRVTTVTPGRTATRMQQQVHEQEGRRYDPTAWIDPDTVAAAIEHCLDLPRDATITELTVRPARV